MKSGEIYWAKPEYRKCDKHPIVCLEDCDTELCDEIKVCILSTKPTRKNATIKNVEFPKTFFNLEEIRKESEKIYKFIQSHNFYVVSLGILKPVSHMQSSIAGTIQSNGVDFVVSLLEGKSYVHIHEDIQTYVNQLNKEK